MDLYTVLQSGPGFFHHLKVSSFHRLYNLFEIAKLSWIFLFQHSAYISQHGRLTCTICSNQSYLLARRYCKTNVCEQGIIIFILKCIITNFNWTCLYLLFCITASARSAWSSNHAFSSDLLWSDSLLVSVNGFPKAKWNSCLCSSRNGSSPRILFSRSI